MMSWRYIKQFTTTVLTVLLLVMSLAALYALSQGAKFLSVQSGSMVPTYHKGDLVVDMRVPVQQLAVGDVVTYTNPRLFNGEPITHRIIQTPSNDNDQQFVTKGDANPAADPPIKAHNIIGKVGFSVPLLGFLFDFVRKPLGLLILIYVPAITIVVAEIRRLMKYYQEQEPYVATGFEPHGSAKTPAASSFTSTVVKVTAIGIAIAALIVPAAQAALMSSVSLADTTLRTAPPAPDTPSQTPDTPPQALDHLLISQVTFSNGSNDTTTPGTSNTTTNNTNNVSVTNNNSQTATSGRATATGGRSATSGNATNTGNTNININVSNGGSNASAPAGSTQSVTLFNPTSQPVNLANWQLADNSTAQTISNGTIVPNGTFVFTWPVANGFSSLGDHLILRNSSAAVVDSLSWGADTTQFNPSVATTNATASLTRKSTTADTNTASDWQAAP